MAVDPVQVGPGHHLRGALGVRLGHPPADQDGLDLGTMGRVGSRHVCVSPGRFVQGAAKLIGSLSAARMRQPSAAGVSFTRMVRMFSTPANGAGKLTGEPLS